MDKKTLKDKIRESMSKKKRVLKESFREDFYNWYDSLSGDMQSDVDNYMEDEGYPEFLSDCSDSDLEIVMDHFNPDYFDGEPDYPYDEGCTREGCKKESCKDGMCEGKLHPFTKEDWYGYAGAQKFPDGSDPMIYEDPETGNAIIVSYDDYSDDIVVEVDLWKDDDSMDGFTKNYQGDRQKAIADAEDIISMGWLNTGDPNAFGNDWTKIG